MTRWPDHDYIEKHYPKRGRAWLANRTGRLAGTIYAYARRHGMELGDLPDHIRVTEIAAITERPAATVWQRADAEGVIRSLKADTEARGTFAAVVPLEWADQYIREYTAQEEATRIAEEEGWLTVKDLAKLWKVAKSTILRNLNDRDKQTLGRLLDGKRIRRGLGPHKHGVWLMHPVDARDVADELSRQRAQARKWISTKSLAIEAGVKQTYAADVGKSEFGGELLFVHGRLMCYVPPEAANRMRRRFAEGVTPGKRRGRPRAAQELLRRAA